MNEENPFFAKAEPSRIQEQLNYFKLYTDKYPRISLLEVCSFFRASIVYIVLPVISLLLLCMHPYSFSLHLMGLFIIALGVAVIQNCRIPLPNRMNRVYLSSKSINQAIDSIQKFAESVQLHNVQKLSQNTYVIMYKTGGWVIAALGLALFIGGRHPMVTGVSTCLLAIGVVTEQARYFAAGLLLALFVFLI